MAWVPCPTTSGSCSLTRPHTTKLCHAVLSHILFILSYLLSYFMPFCCDQVCILGHSKVMGYKESSVLQSSEGVGAAVCSPGFLHRHSVGGKLSHLWEVRISFPMTGYERGCSSLGWPSAQVIFHFILRVVHL